MRFLGKHFNFKWIQQCNFRRPLLFFSYIIAPTYKLSFSKSSNCNSTSAFPSWWNKFNFLRGLNDAAPLSSLSLPMTFCRVLCAVWIDRLRVAADHVRGASEGQPVAHNNLGPKSCTVISELHRNTHHHVVPCLYS